MSVVDEENRLIGLDDDAIDTPEYRSVVADFNPDLDVMERNN